MKTQMNLKTITRTTVLLNLLLSFFFAPPLLAQIKIDANGNVGINNSSPTKKLDVTGNANVSGTLTVNNIAGSTETDITIDGVYLDND